MESAATGSSAAVRRAPHKSGKIRKVSFGHLEETTVRHLQLRQAVPRRVLEVGNFEEDVGGSAIHDQALRPLGLPHRKKPQGVLRRVLRELDHSRLRQPPECARVLRRAGAVTRARADRRELGDPRVLQRVIVSVQKGLEPRSGVVRRAEGSSALR